MGNIAATGTWTQVVDSSFFPMPPSPPLLIGKKTLSSSFLPPLKFYSRIILGEDRGRPEDEARLIVYHSSIGISLYTCAYNIVHSLVDELNWTSLSSLYNAVINVVLLGSKL